MNKYKSWLIGIGFVLLVLAIGALWSLMEELYFTAVIFGILFGLFITLLVGKHIQVINNIAAALKAVERGDYSKLMIANSIPEELLRSIQNIQDKQRESQGTYASEKRIFEQIIDQIDTGVFILKETENLEREIFYVNEAFARLLEIPRFSKWELAKKDLSNLKVYFESWEDRKELINLSINGKEQLFSLRSYCSKVYDCRYQIINLDTLQSIMDRKEKEAWYDLMKVMSHEILNTITPINALSDNLEYLIDENKTELGDNFSDIHMSVITIQNRTKHLADFVNTYRTISDLPMPQQKQVKIKDLVDTAINTLDALLKEYGIKIKLTVRPANLYFNVDRSQVEQTMINLITNSIYALEGIEKPTIEINIFEEKNKHCIEIIDNGCGIPEENKRDVFVPFFTTRMNGSGIGLTLCKNIVQAHNGTIGFSTTESTTRFLLQFPF